MKLRPKPPDSVRPPRRVPRSLLDDPMGSIVDFLVAPNPEPYRSAPKVGSYDKDKEFMVWHGSPFDFDRFDMGRRNTGEGVNAYGPGLYLTETRGVAENYARDLAGWHAEQAAQGELGDVDTTALDAAKAEQQLLEEMLAFEQGSGAIYPTVPRLNEAGLRQIRASKKLSDIYSDLLEAKRAVEAERAKVAAAEEARKKIVAAAVGGATGTVYEVGIGADRGHMIDSDAPARQQPEHVKAALVSAFSQMTPWQRFGARRAWFNGRSEADEIIYRLSRRLGDKKFMDTMVEGGVPGIRYRDGFSRAPGGRPAPTFNYVMFRDDLLRIVGKYVVPGRAAAR